MFPGFPARISDMRNRLSALSALLTNLVFIVAIRTVQIVSWSLFTSIALQFALQCIETAIQQSQLLKYHYLPTEDIMD